MSVSLREGLEGTKEEGEVGQIERVAWTYMHDHAGPYIRYYWEAVVEHRELSSVLCDELDSGVQGRRKTQEERNINIFIADSCCCKAIILQLK